MRKNKKQTSFRIEEENQIVLLYLDKHVSIMELVRTNGIGDKSQVYKWVKHYQAYGTVMDNRGKATKTDSPKKVDPENMRKI